MRIAVDATTGDFDGSRRDRAFGSLLYPGHVASVGIPHRANIFVSSSTSFLPWNNGSLETSSANIQPTLQISTGGP